jgi:hypothetical protein
MELKELTDDDVRFQANGSRIAADKGTSKDTLRPVRDVIPLQPLQEGQFDFRLFSDSGERNLLSFTLQAKSSTEAFIHDTPRRRRTHGQRQSRFLVRRSEAGSYGP